MDYRGRFGKIGPTRCAEQPRAVLARSDCFRDFPNVLRTSVVPPALLRLLRILLYRPRLSRKRIRVPRSLCRRTLFSLG